jgi:two-component system chemotaxis response regulator CheB
MAHRDVIVIGASSGGVEALSTIVSGLPEDLPAAVFIVLHVRPDVPSHLPAILNRCGRLPASHAVDEEPIRRGRIYVAPPGVQMYLQPGRISLRRGPSENSHRPAIDPLFRTAAHYYGPRVIGVVLTGAMDDGSAGLLAVKRGGGLALAQDPREAAFPDMPANALEAVDSAQPVATDELPALLVTLTQTDLERQQLRGEIALETVEEAARGNDAQRSDELGRPSDFVCPDCSGTLYEIDDGASVRFRCRVGHAYSADAMVDAQADSLERALWTALRALEERSALMRRLAENARRRGHHGVATLFEQRSNEAEADVHAVHRVVTNGRALEPVGHDNI